MKRAQFSEDIVGPTEINLDFVVRACPRCGEPFSSRERSSSRTCSKCGFVFTTVPGGEWSSWMEGQASMKNRLLAAQPTQIQKMVTQLQKALKDLQVPDKQIQDISKTLTDSWQNQPQQQQGNPGQQQMQNSSCICASDILDDEGSLSRQIACDQDWKLVEARLEELTDQYISRGLDPEEARFEAENELLDALS